MPVAHPARGGHIGIETGGTPEDDEVHSEWIITGDGSPGPRRLRRGERRPLTILVAVEPRTLDPHFATTTVELNLLMNVFDALVVRRADMTLGPGLAERWKIDRTRKVWTFHLRKGVRFTNGEPFDARSVKFTFGRMVSGRLRPWITVPDRIALERVEIADAHTVRIHTRSPAAALPSWLVNAFMLAPEYYGGTSPRKAARNPGGDGPLQGGGLAGGRRRPHGGERRLVEGTAGCSERGLARRPGGFEARL